MLVLCPADNFAKSFEFGEDGVGGSGPHEGLGVLIVVFNELMDFALQIGHGVEGAAADRALRDESEPALDLIEPGGVGGGVVNVEACAACEPRFDFGMFVRAVIIDDQMHVEVLRDVQFDVPQEAQELLMPVARLALREHLAIGDVQSGKQSGGAVADVVVRDPFDVAQSHRQQRLRALEGLDLTLLVDTQHERIIRRIQIQPDHIAKLFDKERIGRELEGPRAMRLHAKERKVALHSALGYARFASQIPHAPMACGLWPPCERRIQKDCNVLFGMRARPSGLAAGRADPRVAPER